MRCLLRDSSRPRQPPASTVFGPSWLVFESFRDRTLSTRAGGKNPLLRHLCGFVPPTGRFWFTRRPTAEVAPYCRCALVNRSHPVHAFEHAFASVIASERRCLCPVGRKPLLEHFRIVVGADFFPARDHLSHAFRNALKENSFVQFQLD